MYLVQGHNTATQVRIEPRPLAQESDALPLGYRASPINLVIEKYKMNSYELLHVLLQILSSFATCKGGITLLQLMIILRRYPMFNVL